MGAYESSHKKAPTHNYIGAVPSAKHGGASPDNTLEAVKYGYGSWSGAKVLCIVKPL